MNPCPPSVNGLQMKYPKFRIKSSPLPECPKCGGSGEFQNQLGDLLPCSCVCIVGDDNARKLLVQVFEDTIQESLEKRHDS